MDIIELKNKKLIILGLFILFIGYLFTVKNDKVNRIKVDKFFDSDSFITVPNNTYKNYNLTYGEMTWEGMENISKYMELKDWSKNTFIDLGSGNGTACIKKHCFSIHDYCLFNNKNIVFIVKKVEH
jgi:hypothetical protein